MIDRTCATDGGRVGADNGCEVAHVGVNLTRDRLVALILAAADEMIAARDVLNRLDSEIGDGDMGITLTLGFRAVKKALGAEGDSAPALDLQRVMAQCGEAFADAAASTFGTLVAAMFMRAGRAIRGKDSIGPAEAAAMLRAAADGVRERGKADVGDKTVLDALVPAAQAAEDAAARGVSLPECVRAALAAAGAGADGTAQLRSRAGRSAWFGDRTIGPKDPGAVALVLWLEAVAKSLDTC